MTELVVDHLIPRFDGGVKIIALGLLAAVGGLALLIAGWVSAPARTFLAYLTGFAALVTIALGALIFLMIVRTMRAKWPIAIRRPTEVMAMSLVVLTVAFVPVIFGLDELYVWSRPVDAGVPGHVEELLDKKRRFLNDAFFLGRSAGYFVTWLLPLVFLYAWSRRQDEAGGAALETRMRAVSAAWLLFVGIALTFAAFDWLMSLDPTWFSTMFGIYVFASGILAAIATLTIFIYALDRGGWLRSLVNRSHYYALGRLLLTFVIFWAYVTYFQFFLIWSANKPEEVAWYIARLEYGWENLAAFLVFGHFALPFILLLSYKIKRTPWALVVVSVWLLICHYLHMHWIVVPSHAYAEPLHACDLGSLLFFFGLTTAFSVWLLRGRFIVPPHAPDLAKALEYHSA
jgi:hypothetical protein